MAGASQMVTEILEKALMTKKSKAELKKRSRGS
jgi:hypothetical protein